MALYKKQIDYLIKKKKNKQKTMKIIYLKMYYAKYFKFIQKRQKSFSIIQKTKQIRLKFISISKALLLKKHQRKLNKYLYENSLSFLLNYYNLVT